MKYKKRLFLKGILYRNKCIACGYCVSLAPELWGISHYDGKVIWLNDADDDLDITYIEIQERTFDLVKQSADNCPVNAIKVF